MCSYGRMLFPPQPSEPPEQRQQRERACHREALHDLVILGINTAKALERRAIASANEGTNTVIEAAVAFERIARAIRRTILLAEKLAEPIAQSVACNALGFVLPHPEQNQKPQPGSPRSPRAETIPDYDTAEPSNPTDRPESLEDDPKEDTREDAREDPSDDAPTDRPIPEQIAGIRRDLTTHTPAFAKVGRPQSEPIPPYFSLPDKHPQHDWVGPIAKKRRAPRPKRTRKPKA